MTTFNPITTTTSMSISNTNLQLRFLAESESSHAAFPEIEWMGLRIGAFIEIDSNTYGTVKDSSCLSPLDFGFAYKNLLAKDISVRTMVEVLSEYGAFPADFFPTELYVAQATQSAYGAVALLRTDWMETLANELNDDLFILPASVHELIVVRASDSEASMLLEMVKDINRTTLSEKEKLADCIFLYSRDSHLLERM